MALERREGVLWFRQTALLAVRGIGQGWLLLVKYNQKRGVRLVMLTRGLGAARAQRAALFARLAPFLVDGVLHGNQNIKDIWGVASDASQHGQAWGWGGGPPADPQGKASVAGQPPMGRGEGQLALPSTWPPPCAFYRLPAAPRPTQVPGVG